MQSVAGYYSITHTVSPFTFEGYPSVGRWLEVPEVDGPTAASTEGRGQMERYWHSILAPNGPGLYKPSAASGRHAAAAPPWPYLRFSMPPLTGKLLCLPERWS
jgi:hypothetical protein